MSVIDWSVAPDANAVADPTIPARDGASARQVPGLVRGVMAKVAAFAADQGGALETAGTANAYAVTTTSGVAKLRSGVRLAVRPDRDNTAAASLNVDGAGPKAWLDANGAALGAGRIRRGRLVTVSFDEGRDAWLSDTGVGPSLSGVGDVPGLPAALTTISDDVDARFILVPNLTALASYVIPDDVTAITVARYRANTPEAPAVYRRLSALPTHALAAQDAQGQWWGLAERRIAVEVAGAAGKGADDALALDRARYFAEATACPVVLAQPYYSSQAIDFRNVVLDPAPGAALTGRIDFTRFSKPLADLPVSVDADGIKFDSVVSSKDRPTGLQKSIWASGSDAMRRQRSYRALDCTAIQRQQNSYPGSDIWTDTPGVLGTVANPGEAAVNSDQMKWNIAQGGIWYCGFVPIHGAQALRAHFATPGVYTRGAFVRTSAGYYGVFAGETYEATFFSKLTGQTLQQRQLPTWPGLRKADGSLNASAQQPGVSNWEIEIESHEAFRVKLNGQDISGRITILTGAEILDAGFGAFANADPVQPVVDYWTLVDTTEATGRRPMDIAVFGDSQAAARNGDITHALRETLDGTNGIRVQTITNRAVAGTNTADAVNQLNTNGIGAARYVVLMTGVNNQQQGSDLGVTRNNVANWIDGVRSNNGTPIVVIEPRFFLRSEGNPFGFVTVNAGSPLDYRGCIINTAAARGASIVDLNEVLGPIVPGGLPGAFDIIEDNIHLTPYGKRLAGEAIGRAIIAVECRPLTAAIAQKPMPSRFSNGWSGATQYPTYAVTTAGTTRRLHLGGVFTAGATTTAGTLIYTLPPNLWPKAKTTLNVRVGGSTQRAVVDVSATDGGMRIYDWPTGGTFLNLDACSFELVA